ncbi:hypothetical protein LINPERHAP1_LOCUS17730 [Linum perenne]
MFYSAISGYAEL